MTSMVEKVARAVYCAMENVAVCPENSAHLDYWFDSPDPKDVGGVEEYRVAARAALTALLEPTQTMIRSVDDEDADAMVARGRAYSAFVSMIQAALDEPALASQEA